MKNFQIKDLTITLHPTQTGIENQLKCNVGCTAQITAVCANPTIQCVNNTLQQCAYHTIQPCANNTLQCANNTLQQCTFHTLQQCINPTFQCPVCSVHGPSYIPTPTIPDWTIYVKSDLENFKKSELEELKAGIAELQIKVEEQLKQAPDDMELLENKLKEALEEVTRQRRSSSTDNK